MFEEKEFYNPPPESQDTKEWEKWLDKEKRARAVHKAKYTKSFKYNSDGFDSFFHTTDTPSKINGVYRQQQAFVGFTGSKDDDSLSFDIGCPEDQNVKVALLNMEKNRHKRGRRSRLSRNQRRKVKNLVNKGMSLKKAYIKVLGK